jgi:hypothetical protein
MHVKPSWIFVSRTHVALLGLVIGVAGAASLTAEPRYYAVPGRGQKVEQVGDDFEDPEWDYADNNPKSSTNIDKQERQPGGISKNRRVYESTYRGQPDLVKRVAVPPGGLPGSKHALYLRSRQTGIPGMVTNQMQQDDLLINVSSIVGQVPVSMSPSIVVRVFLPPFDQWEKRTGASFGLRAELEGGTVTQTTVRKGKGIFGRTRQISSVKSEAYWPGFFVQFNSKTDGMNTEDSAILLIRAKDDGQDIIGPRITQTGWWTFGMSFTPDGMVHFYASPGVDDLTEKDHLATTKPYGNTAEKLNTFFFNVVNQDNGRNWSTEWIVDDPALYYYTR